MRATTLARWESRLGPLLARLSPELVVAKYSEGRLVFLRKLSAEEPPEAYIPPKELERVLWGIKFRGPLMNAAGMFKNGECYPHVSNEGAAAYLGGTGTWNAREGNTWVNPGGVQEGTIHLPFAPYRRSHSASNWLGLPNDGDEENARRAQEINRVLGCPIGWSAMGSPDYQGEEKLMRLVDGLRLYEKAGVDFLEINESCPNTQHGRPRDDDLANRLRHVSEFFIKQLERRLPVVVKFSNDTPPSQVSPLVDLLFKLGYSGVNFGNTSIDYPQRREFIHPSEQALYDFFTTDKKRFGVGGGVSGRPLKEDSLALCARAVEYLRAGPPSQEFHVIRTGGIESAADLVESDKAGVALNQWFTGRWVAFARHGWDSYRKVHEEYQRLRAA